jgi:hypothetical protein
MWGRRPRRTISRPRPAGSLRPSPRSRAPSTCRACRSSCATRNGRWSSRGRRPTAPGRSCSPTCRRAATSSRCPARASSRDSPVFTVRAGETTQVLLDTRLTFVPPDVEVRAESPVGDQQRAAGLDERHAVGPAVRDRAARGRRLPQPAAAAARRRARRQRPAAHQGRPADAGRAAGEQRQPHRSVHRRLRLDLPAQSVESVEVLANPFAAEYGRFTTSITQIRTRSGTNEWDFSIGNLMPRFRGPVRAASALRAARMSVRGPIRRTASSSRRTPSSATSRRRSRACPTSRRSTCGASIRSRGSTRRLVARTCWAAALIMFPREVGA